MSEVTTHADTEPDRVEFSVSFAPRTDEWGELDSVSALCAESNRRMCWAPTRDEVNRIAAIAQALKDPSRPGLPRILEVGAGAGLLAHMLAQTGEVEVLATDCREEYSHAVSELPNLSFEKMTAQEAARRFTKGEFEVVLSSWMPLGLNLTPAIRDLEPKAIVYVRDSSAETGVMMGATTVAAKYRGVPYDTLQDVLSYHPGDNYRQLIQWTNPTAGELDYLLRRIAFAPCSTDLNVVEVQLHRGVNRATGHKILSTINSLPAAEVRYPWERELDRLLEVRADQHGQMGYSPDSTHGRYKVQANHTHLPFVSRLPVGEIIWKPLDTPFK